MVSERLKALKSFKNFKNPWRENSDRKTKAKKQSGFQNKKHRNALPIFSRKLDAWFWEQQGRITPPR
jgi:hypothetical protein